MQLFSHPFVQKGTHSPEKKNTKRSKTKGNPCIININNKHKLYHLHISPFFNQQLHVAPSKS